MIAFIKQWKFALILSCILPTVLAIFGVGGTLMARFAQLVVKECATVSNLAEEIISSVRTAQAFGAQEKLTKLYDDSLVAAQRAGYKQQLAGAIMISAVFFSVYSFYGLGFCKSDENRSLIAGQGSRMIASGDLNVGTVLTVVLTVMLGSFSLSILGPQIEAFAKATAAAQKIFQTLERIPSIDSLDGDGAKPAGVEGRLEFKNVTFIYPSRPEGSISL